MAVATIVKPDTILRWKLVARKFNGEIKWKTPGRTPVSREVEALILEFARENRSWGYDRIAGALINLGHSVSDTTIANVLKRNGLPTAPERQTEFVHSNMDVLFATDFFTPEVWSCFGLVTYISVQGESPSEESLGWHR